MALDLARDLLSAGGAIGVADFYVARKHPPPEMAANTWLQRTFWPAWFANDNVFLSADHVPYLRRIFPSHTLLERLAKVPYVGLVMPKVPYYIFVGSRAE